MSEIPPGRPIRTVTYFNLRDAAWDRHQGFHELDFGFDVNFDGGLWGFSWKVVDGWTVVAKSGGRYKLGGHWAPQWGGWSACGEVIPE